MQRFAVFLTLLCAATAVAMALGLRLLADRLWPFTLLAFGPRWPFALAVFPLMALTLVLARFRRAGMLLTVWFLTGGVILFGFMDYRLGLGRVPGEPTLRIMTHNVGASRPTTAATQDLLPDSYRFGSIRG